MPFFKYTTEFPFIHECSESEAQFCDISQLNIERQKPSTNSAMDAIALANEFINQLPQGSFDALGVQSFIAWVALKQQHQ